MSKTFQQMNLSIPSIQFTTSDIDSTDSKDQKGVVRTSPDEISNPMFMKINESFENLPNLIENLPPTLKNPNGSRKSIIKGCQTRDLEEQLQDR